MCTCSSHFGMPAMKSRRSLMTTSCPRPGLTIDRAFVELLCDRYHAYRQTAVQATTRAHRSVTGAVQRWEVNREFERTLQIDHAPDDRCAVLSRQGKTTLTGFCSGQRLNRQLSSAKSDKPHSAALPAVLAVIVVVLIEIRWCR